jgi:hypothetical protein
MNDYQVAWRRAWDVSCTMSLITAQLLTLVLDVLGWLSERARRQNKNYYYDRLMRTMENISEKYTLSDVILVTVLC